MQKRLLLSGVLSAVAVQAALAQERTVSGQVTDRTNGQAIPGVTVLVKGTTIGTSTNADGTFSLSGVPQTATTLQFSFVGYAAQERALGSGSVYNVALGTDTKIIDEVVVTALGLETSRDRLGTAQSTVQGQQLVQSGETSVITALSGKTPGVLITRSTGDPGASANIQIRGASTITGNLQPLIVVDGVPISNSSVGDEGILSSNGGAGSNQVGGVVQASRLNDINPDDIASMEILKGAAAAALWGTRAANGVIVITTKRGRNNGDNRINVSVRSTIGFDQINQTPKLQQAYGQGINGLYNQTQARSWGDKISDRAGGEDAGITAPGAGYQGYITFADGTRRYAIPAGTASNPHGGKRSRDTYDHARDMFKRGYTWDNIATISGGDQRNKFYLSLGNTHTEGIALNNSDNDRTTVRVNLDRQMTDKFRVGVNATYARTKSNRVQQGSNTSGIFLGGLRSPADFNNEYFVGDYTDASGNIFPGRQSSYRNPLGRTTNPGFDNPLWTIDNVLNQTRVNRLLGSLEFSYDITSWLNLLNRTGLDTYTDRRFSYYPIGSGNINVGQKTEESIQETQINNDLILRATKNFTESIGATLLLGTNFNARRDNQIGATASNFVNPFQPANPQLDNSLADSRSPFNLLREQRTVAGYAQADLSLFDQLFLTGTGRLERASTFGPEAQSTFFYPSASGAWQFTKLGALADNKVLSFGKLRAAYGQVGVQPVPYLTQTYYVPANTVQIADGWGSTLDAANFGGGFIRSAVQGNPKIKPERKTEIELGADFRFLSDRLSLGATVYSNRTVDAILSVPVAATSGYTSTNANAAEIKNRGVELNLDAEIIRNLGGFSWTLSPNFSKNRNEVVDLAGAESISLTGFTGSTSRAVKGYQLGALWGSRWDRDESGKIILDSNGFPTLAATEGVIGDPNPSWRGGVNNTFSYKGLSLNVLIDHVHNIDVWNGTKGALYSYGTHADTGVETTLSAAEAGSLKLWNGQTVAQRYAPGAGGSYTFRGSIHDFGGGPVVLDEQWYRVGLGNGFNGPSEQFVEKVNYTRLREVTLTYSLGQQWFREKTKLSSVDFSVTGRNLILWTNYSGVDPETNLTGVSNGRGLDYFNNPSTKSLIFSVKFNY